MLRHIADTLSDTRPDTTDHPGPVSGTFNISLNASQNIDTGDEIIIKRSCLKIM